TEVLALPCDVTPYFAGRIRHACSPHGTRFVSMPDAVGAWLRARRETSVAIVGLSFVADLGPFSAYRESMHGIAVETLGERATERIAELAYHVESHGPDEAGLNRLRDILRQEVRSNTIVLAQAELSVLFNLQGKPSRSGKTIVDPLSIYADAVLDAYLAVDGRDPSLVEPQPDPREAMVRFHHELRTRGIMLVVMPTPLKPAVHPEMLAARYTDLTGALHNPSYGRFVEDLRHAGVVVFDLSDALAGARRSGPQYLVTDSHWRPETMEGAAELLGEFISANVHLPAASDPGFRLDRAEVRNTGDIARMLDLSTDAPLFPSESAWVQRVLQADGSPWRPSPGADVLLMGDSFSNIYSLESMGWGTSAGFAEQLALTLRRPVDRLVQNDQGAFATRAMLRRAPDRLNGKRVVVYQFAARELAFGDWKVIPLPAAGDRSPGQ
ncbi:MAG: alginate O-acetyltransferase AlgX-related protein, partial [Burkholderiales bacterium]